MSKPCLIVLYRAILSALSRKTEGRGRSLLVSPRRIVATSRFARGFSFGVNCVIHGIGAPAFFMGALHPQFLTGDRAGGIHARRNLGRGTSYTRTVCPPGRKGAQFLGIVQGASVMMRTLTRGVSTIYPACPEPAFIPAESLHKQSSNLSEVETFSDVADGVEGLLQRTSAAYRDACRLPSASARRDLRAQISDYLSDLVTFCREIEALPATATRRACNG